MPGWIEVTKSNTLNDRINRIEEKSIKDFPWRLQKEHQCAGIGIRIGVLCKNHREQGEQSRVPGQQFSTVEMLSLAFCGLLEAPTY